MRDVGAFFISGTRIIECSNPKLASSPSRIESTQPLERIGAMDPRL